MKLEEAVSMLHGLLAGDPGYSEAVYNKTVTGLKIQGLQILCTLSSRLIVICGVKIVRCIVASKFDIIA